MDVMAHLPSTLREIRFCIYPVLFGWYDSAKGEESLQRLGGIAKRASQSAPDARITFSSTNSEPLHQSCQIATEVIIQNLQVLKEEGNDCLEDGDA